MGKRSPNHLTDGHILKGLLGLAGPMLVSALLQNVQSLIDLYWVGRLGSSAVAALALSGTALMLMFPLVMGMSTGTVAVVARCIGAGRREDASSAAGQSLGLAVLLGIAAGGLGMAAAGALCRLLGAPADVSPLATGYLRIVFACSFTVFLLFVSNSIFQAAGNTLIPMCVMILSNLLNLVLDPILIFGLLGMPRLGVRGAAIATVISQLLACGVTISLLASRRFAVHVDLSTILPRRGPAYRLMRIGLPGSGQMLARSLMALVLMRLVASCGTAAVAAYGIGMRFHMIILMPAFAIGSAVATMVGQNLGAGKPRRAATGAWLAAGLEAGFMAVCAALLIVFAPPLFRVFDPNFAVVSIGTEFLRTTSAFFVFAAMAIVLGRALHGAGDTVGPMVITIITLWGLQVPLAIFLAGRIDPPTTGIWYAIAAALTLHGLLVTAWFATGRWKRQRV